MANRPRVHPRWAGGLNRWTGSRGKVQKDSVLTSYKTRDEQFTLPEPVIRLAQDEYDRQYPGQPYERMQERGGLSLLEIVGFMADRIERVEKLGPWKEGAVARNATAALSDPSPSRDAAPDAPTDLRPEGDA